MKTIKKNKIYIILILLMIIIRFLVVPIQISGNSMYPTYKDNELLYTKKIFNNENLKKGDVIVYNIKDSSFLEEDKLKPNEKTKIIKRITNIKDVNNDGVLDVYLEGDNSEVSIDSRYMGWLDGNDIIGKVNDQRLKK